MRVGKLQVRNSTPQNRDGPACSLRVKPRALLGDPPFKLVLRPVRRRYDHFSLSAEERRCLEDHRLALWDLAAAADYLHVPRLYYAACMALHVLAESHCRKTRRLIKSMRYKTLGKTVRFSAARTVCGLRSKNSTEI